MHPGLFKMLDDIGVVYQYEPKIKRADILEIIQDFEGLMIRSKTKIDQAFLEKATQLKYIARAGAGLELIDLEEVKRKDICVFAANEGNRDAVAEHVIALILNVFNNINQANQQVKQGIWLREANRGTELFGKTVAIIGYGNNGQATAQKLASFGVKTLAYDIHEDFIGDSFAKKANMNQIFEEADVVSLHVPLTGLTKNFVNTAFINQFKKPFYLINAARGEIVVLADVLQALTQNKILGAGLDVLENEKLDQLTPSQLVVFQGLSALPNVILTPHIAGWTHESYIRINEVLVKKIYDYQIGQSTQNLPKANGQSLKAEL